MKRIVIKNEGAKQVEFRFEWISPREVDYLIAKFQGMQTIFNTLEELGRSVEGIHKYLEVFEHKAEFEGEFGLVNLLTSNVMYYDVLIDRDGYTIDGMDVETLLEREREQWTKHSDYEGYCLTSKDTEGYE